ncbi:GntR family transcriptional regulator [Virgibacillus xinjiangensis]|uniref:GntR family transcriptional regulator n=1 Tax=Virgibacillus xinjiangensis TaxID=393090 RepID=A0ABV7CZI5_9BACI
MPPYKNRRLSTKDFVYSEIKKQIIEGILEPEQSINEGSLATELEISRTPIREALQRLEIEELVIRLPNGRLKVAPISIGEVKELFTVRSLLEGLIVKESTLKAKQEDLEILKRYTQLIIEASETDQWKDVVSYGSQFHRHLYEISQNRTAVKMLNQINDHLSRYRRIGPANDRSRSKQAATEHKEMFEAIRSRQPDIAEELMRKHIEHSLNTAIHSIERHLADSEQSVH